MFSSQPSSKNPIKEFILLFFCYATVIHNVWCFSPSFIIIHHRNPPRSSSCWQKNGSLIDFRRTNTDNNRIYTTTGRATSTSLSETKEKKQQEFTTTSTTIKPSSSSSSDKNTNDHEINQLTPSQESYFNKLNSQTYGSAFIQRLRDLQIYKNKYGSCSVPKRYADNPTLGNWVNKMRQMYRKANAGEKSSMTPERIEILNEMEFCWVAGVYQTITTTTTSSTTTIGGDLNGPQQHQQQHQQQYTQRRIVDLNEQQWLKKVEELKKHLQIQTTIPTNTSLGTWVLKQRREYQRIERGEKSSSLTLERIKLLESIGFDWKPWDTKWDLRVQELKDYKRKYGDCLVPVQYKANPPLGRWVSTQRKYYKMYKSGKSNSISKARIKQLTDLGFVWNRWEHEMDKWNDL